MRKATVTHFLRDRTVLMADQQAKIIGTKGFGGGIEDGETPEGNAGREIPEETGAIREFRRNPEEEGGITFQIKDLRRVAVIDFYNGTEEERPFGDPSMRVIFFNCDQYEGEAIDTVEMINAKYYDFDNLPLDKVIKGDELFLLPILEGNPMTGWIRRTANLQVVLDYKLIRCTPEDLVI